MLNPKASECIKVASEFYPGFKEVMSRLIGFVERGNVDDKTFAEDIHAAAARAKAVSVVLEEASQAVLAERI